MQSEQNSILIRHHRGHTLFITNYPFRLADGKPIECYAIRDGLYSYRTVLGAKATVEAYDYGEPYTPGAITTTNKNSAASSFTNKPTAATTKTNALKPIAK